MNKAMPVIQLNMKAKAVIICALLYVVVIHFVIILEIYDPGFSRAIAEKTKLVSSSKREHHPLHYTMVAMHKRVDKNLPDESIVFIGDSITQGLAVTAVHPYAVNYGIGHDTTAGVIDRIPYYGSLDRAKSIVLAIGTNDLNKRTNDQILTNINAIVKGLPDKVPLLICSIFPIDEQVRNLPGINERIKFINKNMVNISSNRSSVYFMDLTALLVDDLGNLRDKFHIGDGLHLSPLAYEVWISELSLKMAAIAQDK